MSPSAAAHPEYVLYQYTPSLALAVIATILFFLGGLAHVFFIVRLDARIFIPLAIGCFMEAVGYGGRIASHFDVTGLPGFIIQALLILISPALFAASIYMTLGLVVRSVGGAEQSIVPLRWLTKLFVIGDCFSFFVQATGGGIQAGGTLQLLHLGATIIVVGLALQIFFFGCCIVSAVPLHLRIRKAPTAESRDRSVPWERCLWTLYAASGLILIRSVFRIVEYVMGNAGWILEHEFMLYIFDSLFMVSVVAIFLIWHRVRLFRNAKSRAKVEVAVSML